MQKYQNATAMPIDYMYVLGMVNGDHFEMGLLHVCTTTAVSHSQQWHFENVSDLYSPLPKIK